MLPLLCKQPGQPPKWNTPQNQNIPSGKVKLKSNQGISRSLDKKWSGIPTAYCTCLSCVNNKSVNRFDLNTIPWDQKKISRWLELIICTRRNRNLRVTWKWEICQAGKPSGLLFGGWIPVKTLNLCVDAVGKEMCAWQKNQCKLQQCEGRDSGLMDGTQSKRQFNCRNYFNIQSIKLHCTINKTW